MLAHYSICLAALGIDSVKESGYLSNRFDQKSMYFKYMKAVSKGNSM